MDENPYKAPIIQRLQESSRLITLRGVEVHNLKSIDLDLPHRRLIVFCGVSGSGKSSLAFDTLYAEGQRRYIESFSAYTRRFLELLEKPSADRIDGIPPAVAVASQNTSRSGRSTVGTATETNDYLRLLFAKIGRVFCLRCGREVRRDSPQGVADELARLSSGARYLVTFPREAPAPDQWQRFVAGLREDGFVRVLRDGRLEHLDENRQPAFTGQPPVPSHGGLYVVVDRLSAGAGNERRVFDSVETAFAKGDGRCSVFVEAAPTTVTSPASAGGETSWRRIAWSTRLACDDCQLEYPAPEPRLYSFNSPLGACPRCEGVGTVIELDMELGRGRSHRTCPACGGARLRAEALATQVGGKNLAEIVAMKIRDAAEFFGRVELSEWDRRVGRVMLEQVRSRLGYLQTVGLEYLTLDRTLRTLSGGESQRVALTSALGSSLVNMLYVLDEPSIGLHPHDTDRLIRAIIGLRDRGNTVIVVEHEEAMILAADLVVEIGPGAGERGGKVVFQGTPVEMAACPTSLTGDYLSGRREIRAPVKRREPDHGWIRLTGARGNNLRNVTVEFPLGLLCLVAGVSGSGKSTLVEDTLYPALCRRLRKEAPKPLDYDDVFGDGQINDVVMVDQSPIGRSPRSNPVTYLKAFDEIRAVFADTVEARTHNYTAGHFSFNVAGGRCEACQGDGSIEIDMQFLADVYMKCSRCQGRRYRREILDVTYRGRNIADVLEMTVREAFTFFRGQTKVQAKLKKLIDVGLDYLRLGQPANTLSGGESQRLKLAGYLSSARRGRCLFLLDEPTTGLHFSDIVQLLDCFVALLAVGHSLIVVEHNLQLLKAADYLIDLGPGAADEGGRVVAKGTPEMVSRNEDSLTGRFLARALARERETLPGSHAPRGNGAADAPRPCFTLPS
ncbi:MAG TPA: excinuclease ABC subunit UvrA [Pirellulales bacterium]|nr:excinuclease ABC subunit UvrA [Pirellulales bacterium]